MRRTRWNIGGERAEFADRTGWRPSGRRGGDWANWMMAICMLVVLLPVTPARSAPIEGYWIAEDFPGWYGAVREAPNGTLVFEVSFGSYYLRQPDGTLIAINAPGDYPQVTGVNSAGQVVGYSDDNIGGRFTWVWAPDGSTIQLPSLEGGNYLNGDAISEDGWVAGIAFDGTGRIRTFVWDPVGGTRSMADSGNSGWTYSVKGMFDDNRVYGEGFTAGGGLEIYVWSEAGGLQTIGNLGGSFVRVETGDVSGVIAGFGTNAQDEYQAWLWSDSLPLTPISPADPLPNFVPWSVTSDLVVGGPTKVAGEDRGALWTPAGGYQIRDVPGVYSSRVTDVRSDGSAIGFTFDFTNGTRGGIWHPDGSFEFLPDAYRIGLFLPNGQIVGGRASTSAPAIWAPLDADGDGVLDTIDPDGGTGTAPDGAFADAHASGQLIASIGGGDLTVTDEPDPAGVRVVVAGPLGSGVQVQVCGFTMTLFAGTEAVFTCGSVIVDLVSGSLVIEGDGGLLTVSMDAPVAAEVDLVDGIWSVDVALGSATVTVGGSQRTVGAGETGAFQAQEFEGFFDPVSNDGVVNVVKSGRAVPLSWSVSDADGPVTDLEHATLTWTPGPCDSAGTTSSVDQSATGTSGLQNLGDGVYQINWKTPRADAGTCGVLQLDIGDGLIHEALFELR